MLVAALAGAASLCAAAGVATGGATVVTPPPGAASLCRLVTADDGFPAVPAPAGATAPDLTPLQDLRREMALGGMGAGEDGGGVRVATVEFDWDPAHVELDGRVPPRPAYRRAGGAGDISHGTAGLALIGGRADGQGVTGIAPAAALLPTSPVRGPDAADFAPAAAITRAAAGLRAGDVLLVELQSEELGPVDTGVHGAAVADAIAAATAAGIVVVIPAGNAGADVATFGAPVSDTALMVGGGESPAAGGAAGRRASMSNHGRRVDVQGPALGVVTATAAPSYYEHLIGGDGAPHRSYTHCFNGTSSAAAAVAGGIASMQGVARAQRGTPFTPAEVRARLVATGRPQDDPGEGRVGPVPQFRAASDLAAPPAPSALAPAGEAVAGEVTLRWRSPEDAPERASGRAEDVLLVDGREVASVAPGVGEARVRLEAGAHTWTVRALDRAGNASEASVRLVVARPASQVTPAAGRRPPAAGAVTRAFWAGGRRVVVLRVRLAPGARVRVAGRARIARRGLVRVALRPPRAVPVVVAGPRLRTVVYRLRVRPSGRPLLARVTSPRSPARP